MWKLRRASRLSEILAAVSFTTTFVLVLHTNHLKAQLENYNLQIQEVPEYTASNARGKAKRERDSSVIVNLENEMLEQYRKLDPRSLNITKEGQKLTLMFNRVPKVGSQMQMQLLKQLSYLNGFTFHKDRPQKKESIQMTPRALRKLAELVDVFRPPSVYVKHVCYIDFTALNFTQPIYINMVRDPVERAISWYYYIRAPWYFVERKEAFPEIPLPSSKWLKKDYETCVLTGDKECDYVEGSNRSDFAQLTEFFCGQDNKCTGFNSKYALDRAIENVEKHYAVVGILENMNMTLAVLEHYLPRFFTGAAKAYHRNSRREGTNKNIYKPKVSERVKNIVRKNFTREIEFYEYCKQRLYKQYAALNLPINL